MSPSASARRHSHRRRRLRLVTGTVVVVLALMLGLTWHQNNTLGSTEAAWQSEESATGALTAGVVPAPTLTRDCQFRPGLLGLGARVRIFWDLHEDYSPDDLEVQASTSGLGSVLAPLTGFSLTSNTRVVSDGYRTDVPTNLLGGLLGLGSEVEIAIRVAHPDSQWTSESVSIASNAGLLGGIGGNCRNLD